MTLTDPSTLLLILLAVIAAALLFRSRSRLNRESRRWSMEEMASSEYVATGRVGSAAQGGLPANLAQWEVEIHETARQLSAQLDAKLSLLQALIADADRAAARLESALDRGFPVLPPGSQAESLRPVAGHGRDLREFDAIPAKPDQIGPDDTSFPDDRARRRAEIYHLADYGFAPAEIAHRVGGLVGEIELILSLRDSKAS